MIQSNLVEKKCAQDSMNKVRAKREISTFEWSDGSKYSGEWQSDMCCGKGNLRHSSGVEYAGEWKNNLKDGRGSLFFPEGSTYDGFWKSDVRHGMGLMMWRDGRVYQGFWRNDKRHGRGTFVTASGLVFQGMWKENKLVSVNSIWSSKCGAISVEGEIHQLSFLVTQLQTCDDD